MSDILYKAEMKFTDVVDFGTAMPALLSGEIPPQGGRVNVSFEGQTEGRLNGSISGTDYINVRADGKVELNIFATIECKDGSRLAFHGVGTVKGRPDSPIVDLFEQITLHGQGDYGWVNGLPILGFGTVDLSQGTIQVTTRIAL